VLNYERVSDGQDDEVNLEGEGNGRRDKGCIKAVHSGEALGNLRVGNELLNGINHIRKVVKAGLPAIVLRDVVGVIRVRANDRSRQDLRGVDGQRSTRILQKHRPLAHSVASELHGVVIADLKCGQAGSRKYFANQCTICTSGSHLVRSNRLQAAGRIEEAKADTHAKEALEDRVNVSLRDESLLQR
jgi:hypothetical protein